MGDYIADRNIAPVEQQSLTPREIDILRLLAKGLSNKSIAEKLYLSEKTIKNRISEIFCKLGVSNRVQAALIATQNPSIIDT